MDQLKQYWEIAKKQHFWILCGLAVLAPLIASLIANGYLAKVYGDQKGTITRINGELVPLVGTPDHPNRDWVQHVHDETDRLRGNVLHAWESLYNRQKDVLKWPSYLGDDFIAAFSKPAESDDPRALEPLCERYQNRVKIELSHLADIVKAEWAPGATGAGRAAAGASRARPAGAEGDNDNHPDEPKKTYIVDWDSADQARLVADYDWQDPPSPLDVRYAQEELWVLEAICNSIDRTNVGATGDFDAVVREIDSILIGYDATDKFPLGEGAGRIEQSHKSGMGIPAVLPNVPGGPASALEPKRPERHRTTDEGALGGQFHSRGGRFAGGPGGALPNQTGPADPDAWLKDGRYVDSKGKPMLGSDWANSTSPEFNQMAFKLTIVADEQRWQKILLELCNSPLPLEVREVRINPEDHAGGRGAGEANRSRSRHDPGSPDSILHNVTLEIHGVAYLINPPNLARLGITAASVTPDTTAPSSAPTPSATPPVAAPIGAPAAPPVAAPPTAAPPTATPTASSPPSATVPATVPPTASPPATAPPATAPPTTVPPSTLPPGK